MPKRGRILGWMALGVMLVCFAFFLLRNTGARSPGFQPLPDGSWLKIGGVSYANTHNFRSTSVGGWRGRLAQVLPKELAARLDWANSSGGMSLGGSPGLTNLAIFTVCLPATNGSFGDPRQLLSDEQGNSFAVIFPMGTLTTSSADFDRRTSNQWLAAPGLSPEGKNPRPEFLRVFNHEREMGIERVFHHSQPAPRPVSCLVARKAAPPQGTMGIYP